MLFTASTASPRARLAAYTCWMAGISARQGPHQLAHRLTMTTWPRKAESAAGPLSIVFKVKSGAGNPSRGLGICPLRATDAGTRENQVQPPPTNRSASAKPHQRLGSCNSQFIRFSQLQKGETLFSIHSSCKMAEVGRTAPAATKAE